MLDFSALVLVQVEIASLYLDDAATHCRRGLREIMTFRFDPLFEWISLLTGGFAEVVAEFKHRLGIRPARKDGEDPKDARQ